MSDTSTVACPSCGTAMVCHAEKLDREASRDAGSEMVDVSFCCPKCGETVARVGSAEA